MRSRSRKLRFTLIEVGGVDTVSLGVVEDQRRLTAAVIRTNCVHTNPSHTALLFTLIMI